MELEKNIFLFFLLNLFFNLYNKKLNKFNIFFNKLNLDKLLLFFNFEIID